MKAPKNFSSIDDFLDDIAFQIINKADMFDRLEELFDIFLSY